MNIQINSVASYIGLALLALGGFMILAGFDIINIQQVTIKQGRRTWVVGIVCAFIGILMLFPEFNSSFKESNSNSAVENISTEIATKLVPSEKSQDTQQATCGKLKLDAIQPSAILENELRKYKLIGSGFCYDTSITISTRAFVGNNPNSPVNSQPIEVSSDGTWLTVYIEPVFSPDQSGASIYVNNPNGDSAFLYVDYQR